MDITYLGAPSKYKKRFADEARKLCLLGAKDTDLAEFFGVCERTINYWKKEFPDFLQSIKKGKDLADAKIAESLYLRALGYEHHEEKVFCHGEKIITHRTTKKYPPETAAAIFWLKNRQKGKWKDKQDIDISGDLSITLAERLTRASERTKEINHHTEKQSKLEDC